MGSARIGRDTDNTKGYVAEGTGEVGEEGKQEVGRSENRRSRFTNYLTKVTNYVPRFLDTQR